jgi:hypothetical protein
MKPAVFQLTAMLAEPVSHSRRGGLVSGISGDGGLMSGQGSVPPWRETLGGRECGSEREEKRTARMGWSREVCRVW